MKKRKLKLFPVVALLVVVIVVVYAVVLIGKAFKPATQKENIENNDNNVETNQTVIDTNIEGPVEEQPVVNETQDLPEENLAVLEETAPKPLMTHEELLSSFPDTVLKKTEDAGQSYIDDMLFIGDSTTHGMAFYGVLEGGKETTQVWTPKSGTLAMWNLLTENIVYPDDGSEMLIADAIAIKQPKIVVLTLGVNGVSSLSEDQFKGYYSDLIDAIKENSSETKIILQSIYPVCDYYEMKSISMEKINQANLWIAELAKEQEAFYLNTISALVNEKGYLNNDYCNGDGIHISREGFNVILDYIRTHSIYE